jgi:ABC-type phosphate transport system substrate-binding protein
MDHALRAGSGGGNLGTATVDIDFSGAQKKKSEQDRINQAFIDVKIHRSPQAPMAGGGVTAFNTYAFE